MNFKRSHSSFNTELCMIMHEKYNNRRKKTICLFCDHDFCKRLEVLLQSCNELNPYFFVCRLSQGSPFFTTLFPNFIVYCCIIYRRFSFSSGLKSANVINCAINIDKCISRFIQVIYDNKGIISKYNLCNITCQRNQICNRC
jgi:hypothetical protein